MADERALPMDMCATLHGECSVCADAGIPVWVLSVTGDDAVCEDAAGNRACIAVEFVAPVNAGDGLLTHGGVAIGRVERRTARSEEEIA